MKWTKPTMDDWLWWLLAFVVGMLGGLGLAIVVERIASDFVRMIGKLI